MPEMKLIPANKVALYDQIVEGEMVLRVNKITRNDASGEDKIYFEGKHTPTWVDYYVSYRPDEEVEIYEFFKRGIE